MREMNSRSYAPFYPPPPPPPPPYVNKTFACALALLISTSATAQFLPPPPTSGLREWTNGSGNDNWGDAGNWNGGIPNDQNTHALFENHWEGTEAFVTNNSNRTIGSLWFNAGTFYTLQGTGEIELKGSGDHLIVVRATVDGPQSEHNIENVINLSDHGVPGDGGFIENYSEGGLRFGGRFALGDRPIRFRGTGAIHIAGEITGKDANQSSNGNIRVQGALGTEENVHVIFSGYNPTKGGTLNVDNRGFAIFKRDQSLGSQTDKYVNFGGTAGFRSHLETPLTYNAFNQNNHIYAAGLGIRRSAGTQQIGAIYNDGGYNVSHIRIGTASDSNGLVTGLGSRGDRRGRLELRNHVGGSSSFLKLGPGLIVLNNQSDTANSWGYNTTLRAGVLRIGNATSLAKVNLVFEGGVHGGKHGGILELGYSNDDDSSWSRSLGTGDDQLRWLGDGGFSAFGGARSVTISGTGGNPLIWGSTEHFIGEGHALLLSSRYANNLITFTNAIDLNGQTREVRVERGENAAQAELSGALSGSGGGLLKTGDGLLLLSGEKTYTGATRIEAGALRGATSNTSSNIVLAGGVLGIDADFTRGIGGSGNQIQWAGDGGFAAYGGSYKVTIGNTSGGPLNWNTTINPNYVLRFGHHTATGTVRFDNRLTIGSGTRTIHIERGRGVGAADVEFFRRITAEAASQLRFVGNGRINLTANNDTLSSATIAIYGAELRLHSQGKLGNVGAFDIAYGGILDLGNTTIANSHNDRLKSTAAITLAGGRLKLRSDEAAVSQEIGDLTLGAGANTVDLLYSSSGKTTELRINKLLRTGGDDARATLALFAEFGAPGESGDFATSLISFKLTESASGHTTPNSGGDAIIPWATNGADWLTAVTENNTDHFLKPLANYHDAASENWSAEHNVRVSAFTTVTLSGDNSTVINSLAIRGNLDIAERRLTLSSGGLVTANTTTFSGGSGSHLTTELIGPALRRPLYIHNWNGFTINGDVQIFGDMDVVKSEPGRLTLNSSATHQIGSLYIHEGTVDLSNGGLLIRRDNSDDHYRIYIGDGAGTDKLILPGGRWNPITKAGGLPSITLRGTPYDPRGPEYSGDQAILQLGGNGPYGAGTKQRLANLRIEGRGTIDWRGGEVGLANILWIDSLSFSSTSDRLFIRNWYEYEDLFLVKREGFQSSLLNQIIFEGYQDYFPTWKDYDKDYYQIYPFGIFPEPSTYGAILGVVGLGLVVWRKRKKTHQPPFKGRLE